MPHVLIHCPWCVWLQLLSGPENKIEARSRSAACFYILLHEVQLVAPQPDKKKRPYSNKIWPAGSNYRGWSIIKSEIINHTMTVWLGYIHLALDDNVYPSKLVINIILNHGNEVEALRYSQQAARVYQDTGHQLARIKYSIDTTWLRNTTTSPKS